MAVSGVKAELVTRLEEDDENLAKYKARLGNVETSQVGEEELDGLEGLEEIAELDIELDDEELDLGELSEEELEIIEGSDDDESPLVDSVEEVSEGEFDEFEEANEELEEELSEEEFDEFDEFDV